MEGKIFEEIMVGIFLKSHKKSRETQKVLKIGQEEY